MNDYLQYLETRVVDLERKLIEAQKPRELGLEDIQGIIVSWTKRHGELYERLQEVESERDALAVMLQEKENKETL